ncbi:Uncharacterised protein [Klebsiella pneumoniae]|uniref:Uncharacterized protein n=1 Tax=Klebsiella pneumoniae TaxID=573 RepID=A0A2X3H2D8_KLEPN|nr:Uncharacterised protein [Klebsiella pneumoniae]
MMQMFKYPQERRPLRPHWMPASYAYRSVLPFISMPYPFAKQVCHADVGPANC